ncbi:MAG TPA: hypothetical protein VIJ94_17465 [Caulobacteraceae bacterium]
MRLPLLIAALVLGAAGAAAAQQQPQPVYTQLFVSPMGEPFRATDAQPYPSAAWFAGADANHDGVISREEFRADAQRFFKLLDVNGDGKLSDAEMHRYEVVVAPEIVAASIDTSLDEATDKDFKGDTKQTSLSAVRQGASFYGLIDTPEPVRASDADFNQKVTLEEWMDAANRRFHLLLPDGKDGIRMSDLPPTPFQLQIAKTSHKH